jgi:hypothetical protein
VAAAVLDAPPAQVSSWNGRGEREGTQPATGLEAAVKQAGSDGGPAVTAIGAAAERHQSILDTCT